MFQLLVSLPLLAILSIPGESQVSYICKPSWFKCIDLSSFTDYSYPISVYWTADYRTPNSLSCSEHIPVPPSKSVREVVHVPSSTLYHPYTLPPTSPMLVEMTTTPYYINTLCKDCIPPTCS